MTETLTPREAAIRAADAANEKKATDIIVQEVGVLTSMTDYFVTVSVKNDRQAAAVIDAVEDALRDRGIKVTHREITPGGSWSLLDYGSIIVHVFTEEARDHYRLETLWESSPLVDLGGVGISDLVYSERMEQFITRCSEALS